MTAKQFFKSTSFKCIATLLGVLLVCGIFLTIMNGLLEVTEEEKFQRVLSSIYGKNVTTSEQNISDKNTDLKAAKINNVYLVEDDGNYILNVTGKNAYQGNVICWVVVKPSADKKSVGGIGNVKVPSTGNDSQSFLNKISSSMFDRFAQDYKDGIIYSYGFDDSDQEGEMYVKTDASYTMRGVCNAVNGSIQFMNAFLSGGDIEEEDPYKEYAYHGLINMESTSWVKNGSEITYSIVTTGNAPAASFEITVTVDESKTVKAFEITKHGSTDGTAYGGLTIEQYNEIVDANVAKFIGKDADYFAGILGEDEKAATNAGFADNELTSGATKSTVLCLAAAAFATSNYELIINTLEYTSRIDMENTGWTVADGEITFTIKTLKNAPADPFEITVTVGADKTITALEITKHGSTDGTAYGGLTIDEYNAIVDANAAKLIGKGLDYFKAVLDDEGTNAGFADNELSSGATKSTVLCLSAAAFAVANYDYCLTHVGGGESNE